MRSRLILGESGKKIGDGEKSLSFHTPLEDFTPTEVSDCTWTLHIEYLFAIYVIAKASHTKGLSINANYDQYCQVLKVQRCTISQVVLY